MHDTKSNSLHLIRQGEPSPDKVKAALCGFVDEMFGETAPVCSLHEGKSEMVLVIQSQGVVATLHVQDLLNSKH